MTLDCPGTDMTPAPEPPKGYELWTDYKQPVPKGALHRMKKYRGSSKPWHPSTYCGEVLRPEYHSETFDARDYAVPLSPVAPEAQEHNPDGLTPEQYGAPEFRLLRVGEIPNEGDEMDLGYSGTGWRVLDESYVGPITDSFVCTYRRRISPVAGKEEPTKDEIEMQAARDAVAAGLGASEWEAFMPPANAAEVGQAGQPDGGEVSANPGNDQQASTHVLRHRIVRHPSDGNMDMMTPTCSCGWEGIGSAYYNDDVFYFIRNQEEKHFMSAGVAGYLIWDRPLVTLAPDDAAPASPSTPAQCAAKLSEGQPANAETEPLKPCPFCGSAVRMDATKPHDCLPEYVVGCILCEVQPFAVATTEEAARKLWNTRATSKEATEIGRAFGNAVREEHSQLSTLRAELKEVRGFLDRWTTLLNFLFAQPAFHNSKREGDMPNRVRLFIESLTTALAESERKLEQLSGQLKLKIATLEDVATAHAETIRERDALKAKVEELRKAANYALQAGDPESDWEDIARVLQEALLPDDIRAALSTKP
jgi:hypothetical protein